ncbi:MAG: zinc-binding dehydrogenase [Anaerolineae bacterium]
MRFINYKAVAFESVVKDVDVVLDAVGFDTTTRSLEVLKPGGTLVCVSRRRLLKPLRPKGSMPSTSVGSLTMRP